MELFGYASSAQENNLQASEKFSSNRFHFRHRQNTQKKEKLDHVWVRLDNLPENLSRSQPILFTDGDKVLSQWIVELSE
jgi:hypothetical protein